MGKQKVINMIMQDAWEHCEEEGRSIEYMIEYISDKANVDFNCAMNFIKSKSNKKPM